MFILSQRIDIQFLTLEDACLLKKASKYYVQSKSRRFPYKVYFQRSHYSFNFVLNMLTILLITWNVESRVSINAYRTIDI